MLVQIIDLCGREAARTVDLVEGDDLTNGDVDHILDMWADDQPAFIGEYEYRRVAA